MMRPTTERRSSTLLKWCCTNNNLVLNTSKTKEVIVDYRKSRRTEHAPLLIHGEAVERVNNIKFLGIHITSDLTWSMNTAHLVKKAQQRLFFLRKLKRAGLSPQLLTNFYRATTESILCLSAAVWYGSCTAQDLKGLSPGGENSTGDCGKSSSRPGLNICWPDPEEGPTYCHLLRPYPPGKWTVCTASIWKRLLVLLGTSFSKVFIMTDHHVFIVMSKRMDLFFVRPQ
ncbi:hypothetical protein L3Q82_023021 [Scortum barcoo]|uniref:Uncharacterized protein n=1 Tax=Scortum barcoo TaxID=214431 RepID=A0ACB8WXH6_9TELE|nr:hypothetical protein L3Q82_023021 [Scortum barcoo]